jgi:hypothetical protein
MRLAPPYKLNDGKTSHARAGRGSCVPNYEKILFPIISAIVAFRNCTMRRWFWGGPAPRPAVAQPSTAAPNAGLVRFSHFFVAKEARYEKGISNPAGGPGPALPHPSRRLRQDGDKFFG